jgi:hypothetical protein
MKKALISPNEPFSNGYNVCQVEDQEFEVALPLFWIDCNDEVKANGTFYFDPTDNTIKSIPGPITTQVNELTDTTTTA